MYTIMGASGHTGGAAAKALLDRGHAIRVVGRSAERLQPLAARGAELAIGDANDSAFLATAFDGAEGVYAMAAPAYDTTDLLGDYERAAASIATAAAQSGTPHLVVLSGIGARYSTDVGTAIGLHRFEQALAATGIDQVHLRPSYFFENFFFALPTIGATGSHLSTIEPDVTVTMTATADVGAVAAAELVDRGEGLRVRELVADAELSMNEVTRLLGPALGIPDLPYVRVPDSDYISGLTDAGLSAHVAEMLVATHDAISQGLFSRDQPKTDATTAPTTFESFVPALAGAYAAA